MMGAEKKFPHLWKHLYTLLLILNQTKFRLAQKLKNRITINFTALI